MQRARQMGNNGGAWIIFFLDRVNATQNFSNNEPPESSDLPWASRGLVGEGAFSSSNEGGRGSPTSLGIGLGSLAIGMRDNLFPASGSLTSIMRLTAAASYMSQ